MDPFICTVKFVVSAENILIHSFIHSKIELILKSSQYRGYWTPEGGRLTEYRTKINDQYSTVTGPRGSRGTAVVAYWPFFEDLYCTTRTTLNVQYHIYQILEAKYLDNQYNDISPPLEGQYKNKSITSLYTIVFSLFLAPYSGLILCEIFQIKCLFGLL